jgi:MFS family permease
MYFVTSIICATSTSMKMLIVGRACQGTAGGGLFQLVNITISDLFSMRYVFSSEPLSNIIVCAEL